MYVRVLCCWLVWYVYINEFQTRTHVHVGEPLKNNHTHPLSHTQTKHAQKAQGPVLLTLALGTYTVLALGAATTAEGKTLWLNLTGAATVVGALSVYGGKGKRAAEAARA